MSMSPYARREMRRGSLTRAWQRLVDAARHVEQPNNDRYVFLFCIFAFGFLAGYGLAVHHQEQRAQADGIHQPTKGQP
jgi:hypothetical protein